MVWRSVRAVSKVFVRRQVRTVVVVLRRGHQCSCPGGTLSRQRSVTEVCLGLLE